MLNIEELLIKIMQILDFDMNDIKLKQTLQKRRFYTNELTAEKYREHIKLILEKLDRKIHNDDLVEILIDLINLYISIYSKLNLTKFIASEEKINWIILKRLVIPYLAKRLSSLDCDYNLRIDKGLSGGKFWYLPDITNYPNVKLPMTYIMNWWLDLYGKGFDGLCTEIDKYNDLNKEKNEEYSYESRNTIKQWIKRSIPDRKSIEFYCSIPLNYSGIFEVNTKDSTNVQFDKACKFVTDFKKLSIEELKLEIPYNSLVNKIFKEKEIISDSEKKDFIRFISERWSKPTSKKLINNFLIAKSSNSLYKALLKYFSFKDSNDIEENKLLQLVYLFSFIYNENLQRRLHKVPKSDTFDIDKTNYEYLDSLNNDFLEITKTISNDINIELSNQKFAKNELEDIYQIKVFVYSPNNDEKFDMAFNQLKYHKEYFFSKFDNIEKMIKEYSLSKNKNEKINFIESINDFEFLVNIFQKEFFSDYELAERIVLQMQSILETELDKIRFLVNAISLYTDLSIENNVSRFHKVTTLMQEYEKLIENVHEKEIEFLRFKVFYYIKSKQFNDALDKCIEYFNKYINSKKKDEGSIEMLFFSAYVAYIQKDKKSLKIFNKYLKKYVNVTFENSQSLPIKIYFYKK